MPETFDSKDDKKTANPVPHAQLSRMIEQGRSFSGKETNCVYLNTGNNGLFTDVSFSSGLDFSDDGRSVATVDWDHDGDLDLYLTNFNGKISQLITLKPKTHQPVPTMQPLT